MFTIRKLMKFEMAHCLPHAYSKPCENLHGHSYKLELFFSSKELNEDGMLADFKSIKDVVEPLVTSLFDHKVIVSTEEVYSSLKSLGFDCLRFHEAPTAENMARFIYNNVKSKFPSLSKVRLHETDTGYAEYTEDTNEGQ